MDISHSGTDEGMWRYRTQLPELASHSIVSLGEGGTPLLELPELATDLAVRVLAAKAEHMNPTGSFKDRIASVAMSLVVERGFGGCLGTSSGNGGGAIAAYAARAGRRSILLTPADIRADKLAQIRALGAEVYRLQGMDVAAGLSKLIDETVPALAKVHGYLPFVTAFRYMPEAMEGAKTIAFELAESMADATAVYAPVGGGGLLTAIHRGYAELADSLPHGPPRLIGVQPIGCATLTSALSGDEIAVKRSLTAISGLQVAVLLDGDGATTAVRESGGHATVVADAEIWEAQRRLARNGLLVEPAGAAALAGAIADARTGRLAADDQVVVILTGAGWKDADALADMAGTDEIPLTDGKRLPMLLEQSH